MVQEIGAQVSAADFPDAVASTATQNCRSMYEFDPGAATTASPSTSRSAASTTCQGADFSWPVPGLRQDLVVALIRSLPKRLRVNFVPAPNYARDVLGGDDAGRGAAPGVARTVLPPDDRRRRDRDDWSLDKVPSHLRPTFRVLSHAGEVLGEGKDLDAIKRRSTVSRRSG